MLKNCRLKGKLRLKGIKSTNPVAVGDMVEVENEAGNEAQALITKIYPRNNYITRRSPRKRHLKHIIAANIDQAVLIVTFSQPRTKLGFIDRFIMNAEMFHIPTVLLFNKYDIYTEKDQRKFEEACAIYEPLGYTCVLASAESGHNIEAVEELLKDKVSLVAGFSGVGKSTMINRVDANLELRTHQVSDSTGKGMHTTTFAEMFDLPFGGYIIDTPGIKEFEVVEVEPEEVGHYFREFQALIPECKFNNCKHRFEPKCAVKAAIEAGEIAETRFMSYLSILGDIEGVNYWERDMG